MDEAFKPVSGKGGMTVCATLELFGLAVWVGGLVIILGAVIPEAFNLGLEAGGRLLTKVFARYNHLVFMAIALLGTIALIRVWLAAQRGMLEASVPRSEVYILAIMILIQLVLVLVLVPESVLRQEEAFAAQGEAARKSAHEAFFQSHKVIRTLYVVNFCLGIGMMSMKVRQWMGFRRRSL